MRDCLCRFPRKNAAQSKIFTLCQRAELIDGQIYYMAPQNTIHQAFVRGFTVTIAITSPQNDYGIKLFKYRTAGVREYWIVNPQKKTVTVFDFEGYEKSNQYGFEDDISVCIYDDLVINIADLIS